MTASAWSFEEPAWPPVSSGHRQREREAQDQGGLWTAKCSREGVEEQLATLPARTRCARFLATLNAPAQHFVMLMNALRASSSAFWLQKVAKTR